jgi:hypothetical protein
LATTGGSVNYLIPMMHKEAVFTMKLEQELRDEFLAEAEAAHRPVTDRA